MKEAIQHPGQHSSEGRPFRGEAQELTWGIKESFRQYFERLQDHAYDLGAGAGRTGRGEFSFPAQVGSGPELGENDSFSFAGRVALSAHFGALSVVIADPVVVMDGEGKATLSAVVDEDGGRPVRMVIADLALQSMSGSPDAPLAHFSAALAKDGQYLFMGNYYAGDLLDPVTIRLAPSPAVAAPAS